MNIVTDINTFDSNNVYFLDSVKNTIMSDSNFIRIIYSNDLFMLNGIFLKINLKITNSDKYYNKYCQVKSKHKAINQYILKSTHKN